MGHGTTWGYVTECGGSWKFTNSENFINPQWPKIIQNQVRNEWVQGASDTVFPGHMVKFHFSPGSKHTHMYTLFLWVRTCSVFTFHTRLSPLTETAV